MLRNGVYPVSYTHLNQEENQEEMEEVEEIEVEETIGELLEENPQEDQLEDPNPPEPEIEAEVMVNNQPVNPTEAVSYAHLQTC